MATTQSGTILPMLARVVDFRALKSSSRFETRDWVLLKKENILPHRGEYGSIRLESKTN